jgi:hypothetical protein
MAHQVSGTWYIAILLKAQQRLSGRNPEINPGYDRRPVG